MSYWLDDDEQPITTMCGYHEEHGPGGHAWMCMSTEHRANPEWHYLVPVSKTA